MQPPPRSVPAKCAPQHESHVRDFCRIQQLDQLDAVARFVAGDEDGGRTPNAGGIGCFLQLYTSKPPATSSPETHGTAVRAAPTRTPTLNTGRTTGRRRCSAMRANHAQAAS